MIRELDGKGLRRHEQTRYQQIDVAPLVEKGQPTTRDKGLQLQASPSDAVKAHSDDRGPSFQCFKSMNGGINFDNTASRKLKDTCITKPVFVCGSIRSEDSGNVSRSSDDARNASAERRKESNTGQRRRVNKKRKNGGRTLRNLHFPLGVNGSTKVGIMGA